MILALFMNEIKQIRTYTLSDDDVDCSTYSKTVNFLANVLINEREGHFHYITNPIKIDGRTLILFKYRGKLIAKGIFSKKIDVEELTTNGNVYPGYYQLEKDSIEIFRCPIDLEAINTYFPVKSLSRDQIFDEEYFDEINKMIEDFTN